MPAAVNHPSTISKLRVSGNYGSLDCCYVAPTLNSCPYPQRYEQLTGHLSSAQQLALFDGCFIQAELKSHQYRSAKVEIGRAHRNPNDSSASSLGLSHNLVEEEDGSDRDDDHSMRLDEDSLEPTRE